MAQEQADKDGAAMQGAAPERAVRDKSGAEEAGPNVALLKWIVIGLGILIVIGLAVVVVTVANRMGGSSSRTEAEALRLPAAFGRARIQAGPETEIVEASAGGGVILLTLRAPGSSDIVVVLDAATGQERGRLELDPTPASPDGDR